MLLKNSFITIMLGNFKQARHHAEHSRAQAELVVNRLRPKSTNLFQSIESFRGFSKSFHAPADEDESLSEEEDYDHKVHKFTPPPALSKIVPLAAVT
jgi:hypothetical protein